MSGFERVVMKLLLGALVAAMVTGCRSPQEHRQKADRAADAIIADAQRQALGETGPFTVRPPAQTLRRALLLDQDLPVSVPASRGTRAIEPIPEFPDPEYLQPEPASNQADRADPASDITEATARPPSPSGPPPYPISLEAALMIGARNSRDYQTQKERVFTAALGLELERDAFRNQWTTFIESEATAELMGEDVTGVTGRLQSALSRQFKSGMLVTARIGVDLVRLLSGSDQTLGVFADGSISIPLLRGSGEFVVAEPMRQAQREVIYAIYEFERFKQRFAVEVAAGYLGVLQSLDQVVNAEQNYRNLIASTRRARRLADAGRLPEIQVDQALQDELRARDRWVSAQQSYQADLDRFKLTLGLPIDARIVLSGEALDRLEATAAQLLPAEETGSGDASTGETDRSTTVPPADAPIRLEPPDPAEAGPYEIEAAAAVRLAIEHRLDLRVAVGRIDDTQRASVVAADALRADLRLLGNASLGARRSVSSAGADHAELNPGEGTYSGLITLDLPLERTAERSAYRLSLIELEQAVRDLQDLEDRIKLAVREDLRTLRQNREAVRIQAQSVQVARRRVESTNLFLQAGRAQVRDVLEAQESLIQAENALTAATVRYRVAELELQSDMGLLEVDAQGLWHEYDPGQLEADDDAG